MTVVVLTQIGELARLSFSSTTLCGETVSTLDAEPLQHVTQKDPNIMSTKRTRRIAAASIAGFAAIGGAFASAASLGTITENTLGANTVVIASCDTDGVTLNYTTAYDAASGKYRTATVVVSGIAAGCAGKKLDLTLKNNTTGASLGSGTVASIVGTSATVAVVADAFDVTGAAVVIYG